MYFHLKSLSSFNINLFLNCVIASGSTETSSDKVELLCGPVGVFATAKQLGINIKSDQKAIKVVDEYDSLVKTSKLPHLRSIHDVSLDIADDAEDDSVVVEAKKTESTDEAKKTESTNDTEEMTPREDLKEESKGEKKSSIVEGSGRRKTRGRGRRLKIN